MRVYAKTDKRLRFEVAHDCKYARTVFQPYTDLSIVQLVGRLDFARERAAHTVNEVLTFVRIRMAGPEQSREVHELFEEIFRSPTPTNVARALVSMLVTNGRIVTGAGFNIDLATIQRLSRRGIFVHLARQADSHIWGVAPQYESALQRLRDQSR